MTATSEEHVLAVADGIYRGDGPKRKAALPSGKLGRLVLTDRRLLLLSTGKHDVTAGKLLAGARGNHLQGGRTDRTDSLDVGALANEGGLHLPLRPPALGRAGSSWIELLAQARSGTGAARP